MTETAGTAPRRWRPARRIAPPIVLALLLLLSLNAALPLAGAGAAASHSPYTAVHPDTITLPSAAASTTCASATTCNVAVRSTANSVIVVIIGQWSSDTTPSAVALHGYTDSSIGSKGTASTGEVSAYYFKNVSAAATNTVYVNYSGSTIYQITAVDVGNVTSAPLDGPGTGTTGTGTSAGATFTTTVANELEIDAIAAGASTATDAFTVAASGDTLLTSTGPSLHGSGPSAVYAYGGGAYVIEASAGAHNLTATLSRSTEWWALGFGLLPAAVPQAPTLSHGTVTTTTVPLSTVNVAGPILNATVYQATYSGSCGAYTTQYNVAGLQPHAFTVTGLSPSSALCFYWRNWNTTGEGTASNVLSDVVTPAVLAATLSASPTTTQVGEPSALSYTVTGGVPTVTWTLERNGSVSNLTGASGGSYSAAFTHPATYVFYLNATDAASSTSDKTVTVVVDAALGATLSAAPTTSEVGSTSVLSYADTHGVSPITWTLTRNGTTSNLTGASGGTYTGATYTHPATYTYYFNATDAVGSTSKATATVIVNPALTDSLSASPSTTQAGGTSTLTYAFAHGVSPDTWTLEKNGSVANLTGASGGHYAFTPTHAGTYMFFLNATDHLGMTAASTTTVTVDPALAASLSASVTPFIYASANTSCTARVDCAVNLSVAAGSTIVVFTFNPVYTDYSQDIVSSGSNFSFPAGKTELRSVGMDPYQYSNAIAGVWVSTAASPHVLAEIWDNATEPTPAYNYMLEAVDVLGAATSAFDSVDGITSQGSVPPLSTSCPTAVPNELVLTVAEMNATNNSAEYLSPGAGLARLWGLNLTPFQGLVSYAVQAAAGAHTFGATIAKTSGSYVNSAVMLCLALKPAAPTTQLGESAILSYSFAGGVSPVTWTLQKNGSGSNLTGASGGVYSFTPTHAATYTFYLNSTDAVGSVSDRTATVVVDAALVGSLSASPSTTQVGENPTVSYSFAGGVSPLTWTLQENGSTANLTGASGGHYTFVPAHAATYTFYLNATDTVGSAAAATTTVIVKAALVASLHAAPATTQVGATSTLTYTLAGGVSPVTWTLERNGSVSNLTGASGGAYTFAPIYATTYIFYLNATDAVGSVSDVSAMVVVHAALGSTLEANRTGILVAQTAELYLNLTFGVTPYSWTFELNGSVSNISGASGSVGAFTYVFTGSHVGNYTFFFNTTDAVGSTAIANLTISVSHSGASLSVTFIYAPAPIVKGVSIAFTSTVLGGLSPYTYAWSFPGGGTSSLADPVHVFHSVGTFRVWLNVTDHASDHAGDFQFLSVILSTLSATLTAYPNPVALNGSTSVNFTIATGVAPYVWTLTLNGSALNISSTFAGHYTFHAIARVTFTFFFNVTDHLGAQVNLTLAVQVSPAPICPNCGGPNNPISALFLILIPLGILGTAGIYAYSSGRRRTRRSPPITP